MRPLLTALLVLAGPAAAVAQTPGGAVQGPAGHRLVWSDEFDRPGLPDPALWTWDTHANRTGWYNNERQYYAADRLGNARVEDGRLIIEARRERLETAPDFGGQDYTSARLNSRAAWTYGVFEARARLPCGRGTWPAIWMLPADLEAWPDDGEIDIMEHVGHRPGVVHGTVHTGRYNHVNGAQRGAEIAVADACEAFHVYQVRWTPDAMAFALDGRDYYNFPREPGGGRPAWPFDRSFHLILNVAVGGDWGGAEGIDDAALPQRMEIDWVRVWQVAD